MSRRRRSVGRWRAPAGLAALLVLGCGGGAAEDAGPVDAVVVPDAVCPFPPGKSFVLTSFAILPSDQGFDLSGDGVVDNMLGNLPQAARDSAHDGMAESIVAGELIALAHIADWSEPPVDRDDVMLLLLSGYDWDTPPVPANNLSGDGEFLGRLDQFDLDCQPRTAAEQASFSGGELTASGASWEYPLTTGTGKLTFLDAHFRATFGADYLTMSAQLGAVMSLCSLSAVPFPGETAGTVLDVIINDPTVGGSIQLDVDRDGDGMEQVIGDGLTVLECIDGNGDVIRSRDCPCHPSIVDGYSVGLQLEWISARILGLR